MHPVDWYSAILLKDTMGRYLFSDPQSMVAPRLWAKPVVATLSMAQGSFLVGAFNMGAQIWDREDANIRVSENVNDHFIRNMVAILAEERLALTVYRPAAFVKGTLPTPA
jgi:HK97 family phage major capsid protein